MRRTLAWAIAVVVLGVQAARADVKLPAVLSDNMVLQQKAKVVIWEGGRR